MNVLTLISCMLIGLLASQPTMSREPEVKLKSSGKPLLRIILSAYQLDDLADFSSNRTLFAPDPGLAPLGSARRPLISNGIVPVNSNVKLTAGHVNS